MTKRYNMFNYPVTYFGILACIFPFVLSIIVCLNLINSPNPDTSRIIYFSAICVFCFIIVLPKGIKLILEGRRKAFNCDDDYILGRVRADEARNYYIMNNLDCIKALEYCNGKGCSRCPFHITCRRTNFTWMLLSARRLFDNMEPCTEINRFSSIIDRYNNCDHESICVECPYYDNDCLEMQLDNLQHDVYFFFKNKGYTSADQLRSKGRLYK